MRFRTPERLAKRALTGAVVALAPPKHFTLDEIKAKTSEELNHIILMRHHQHRGDLLLATPVIRALRERYPNAHVSMVAGESTAEVVEHNPDLSSVHILPRSVWTQRNKRHELLSALQAPSPADLCIMLSTEAVSQTGAAIARLSGADIVVGYETSTFNPDRREAAAFYNYAIPAPAPDATLSETERGLGLLTELGIPLD